MSTFNIDEEDFEIRDQTELGELAWGKIADPYVVSETERGFTVWRHNDDGTYSAITGWSGPNGRAFSIAFAAERTDDRAADFCSRVSGQG